MSDKKDRMVKVPDDGIDTKGLVPASEPPEPPKPSKPLEPSKQKDNN